MVNSRQKEFELWARRFTRELGACENLEEWAGLIAENGVNLGECSQFHPTLYVTVKFAIREHSERIDLCNATTSNAPTVRETSDLTPSTSTESDQP